MKKPPFSSNGGPFQFCVELVLRSVCWENAHFLLGFSDSFKFDKSVCKSKESVITPNSNVCSGMHLRAALSNQDATREDLLSSETLHAKSLRITVSAIS